MQSPIKPNDEEKKRRRLAWPHNTVGYLGERVRIKFQSTVNGMLFFYFQQLLGVYSTITADFCNNDTVSQLWVWAT